MEVNKSNRVAAGNADDDGGIEMSESAANIDAKNID